MSQSMNTNTQGVIRCGLAEDPHLHFNTFSVYFPRGPEHALALLINLSVAE